jgi:hypothetical protein
MVIRDRNGASEYRTLTQKTGPQQVDTTGIKYFQWQAQLNSSLSDLITNSVATDSCRTGSISKKE